MLSKILSLFFTITIFASLAAHATAGFREEEVNSANLTGSPYLVVSKDKTGNSGFDKVGIYTRSSNRKGGSLWTLAIEGEVSGTNSGPLLDELIITTTSKNYESLALIDNRIILFSINSQVGTSDSFIRIGSKEALIFDISAKRNVALPPVDSANHISIFQAPVHTNDETQIIVVSVKDEVSDIEEAGFTFAFEVKASDDKGYVNLVGQPIMLDYHFYKNKQLRNFVNFQDGKTLGVFSPEILNQFSEINATDSLDVRNWKGGLKQLALSMQDKRDERLISTAPFIDLESKSVVNNMKSVSSEVVKFGSIASVVQESVINGQDRVVFRGDSEVVVIGAVDINERGEFKVFYDEKRSSALFLLNSELYYVDKDKGNPIKLKTPTGSYDNIEKISIITQEGKDFKVILVSVKIGESREETSAFILKQGVDGEYQVAKTYRISEEYYSHQNLEQRIYWDEEKNIYFDIKTPVKFSNPEAYQQKYNSKGLHVQLSGDGGHLTFIKPITHKIIGQGFSYKEFSVVEDGDDSSQVENKTGLYYQDAGNNSVHISGKALVKPNSSEIIWSSSSIKSAKSGSYGYQIRTFVLDKSLGNGEDGYTVYVSLSSIATHRVSLFHSPKPVSDLVDVIILKQNNDKGLYSIVAITEEEDGYDARVLNYSADSAEALSEYETSIDIDLRVTGFENLLYYDEKGEIFVANSSDSDIESESFSLYNINAGELIYPNADPNLAGKAFSSYIEVEEQKGNKVTKKGAVAFEWLVNNTRVKYSKAFKKFNDRNQKSVKTDLFPGLIQTLEELASKSSSNAHHMLVVPDEIKPHIENIILNQWINNGSANGKFSIKNNMLDFYIFGETDLKSQEHYLKQLSVPESSKRNKKALMYVNAEDVIKADRVQGSSIESQFMIDADKADAEENVFEEQDAKSTLPHSLYLLATEGRKIDPIAFNEKSKGAASYTQLILASKSEWTKLKDQSRLEMSYGLDEHFNVTELGAPGIEDQINLFKKFAQSSEVVKRGYAFDSGGKNSESLSEEENLERLMKYLVTRVENLSREQNKNALLAFSEVLIKYKHALLYDEGVRKTKVVDRGLVERVLARVFTLPLKLKYLPEDDPLVQLSRPDILLRIQNEGKYPGPFDVTKKVVDTILSQTRQESALKIPSTIILDGNSGTGKTQLALSLIKTLKLKQYSLTEDPTSEHNMGSQAFVIHAPKLTTSDTAAGLLNVDEALKHLEHFLSLPFGHRGFIVFDDLHLCSDEVRAKVISRLRTLIDAEDGMVHVKSEYKESTQYESFPGRNLTIIMTYNPAEKDETDKNATSSFYASVKSKEDRGIKALGGNKVQVDRAFFKRIGLYLIMDEFSVEAKSPALIERFKVQSKDIYQDGYFVTLTKDVVDNIVKNFAKTDARHFFSSAINGLTDLINDSSYGSKGDGVKIIVSKHSAVDENANTNTSLSTTDDSYSMREYIEKNLVVLNVSRNNPESLLEFVNLVVNSFRTSVYEGVTKSVISNQKLSGNDEIESAIQSNVMQGILDHLAKHPTLTPLALNLEPSDFAVKSPVEEQNFNESLLRLSGVTNAEGIAAYYPDIFTKPVSNVNLFEQVIGQGSLKVEDRARRDVNTEYIGKLNKHLNALLLDRLNLKSLKDLHDVDGLEADVESWLIDIYQSEAESDKEKMSALDAGKLITEEFIQYMIEMESSFLLEKKSRSAAVESMSFYDKTRMFLYVLDKAISELAWIEASRFLVFALRETVDNEIGGSAVVQNFFYDSNSILMPKAADQMTQILLNSKSRKSLSPQVVKQVNERFDSSCLNMLVGGGSKE